MTPGLCVCACVCTYRCARACPLYIPRGKFTDVTFRSSYPSLRRASRIHHAVEKREKPAEFANGSLLGNDSRIFVQHPVAYPLSRGRAATLASVLLTPSPRRVYPASFVAPSAHFSFSKFYRPETHRCTSSPHFPLCSFSVLFLQRFPTRPPPLVLYTPFFPLRISEVRTVSLRVSLGFLR